MYIGNFLSQLVVFCLISIIFAVTANASNYELGLVQYSQGDYPAAIQSFRLSAGEKELGAADMLAKMYHEGQGTSKDAEETFRWTLVAASEGMADAQFRAAEAYATRGNLADNQEKAFYWYRQAARQGNHDAFLKLGAFYEKGGVVAVDRAEAKRLYLYAASEYDVYAQKGHASSQNQLALMYEHGLGVAEDMQMAFNWYHKAAVSGLATAQFNIGRLLAAGKGVEQNLAEAAYWLEMASGQGMEVAQILLVKVVNERASTVAFRD